MLNDIYQALDPVAFAIGPLVVRWYGLGYIFGFLFAALIIQAVARRWKLRFDTDALLSFIICVIVGVLAGGRLGYVLFYGAAQYAANPLEIFNLSQGGMSFHGGLIGALLAGAVAARWTRIPFLTWADLGVIATTIGIFLVRCANFINGELWGAPTDAPWGVVFGGSAGGMPRHPTQLYEAVLEGLVIFAVLYLLSRKVPPRPQGSFLGVFLVLYGVFRFCIEFVRIPDSHLGYLWGGWLTMGQLLSLPLVIVGAGVLVYAARRKLPQEGIRGEESRGGESQEDEEVREEIREEVQEEIR